MNTAATDTTQNTAVVIVLDWSKPSTMVRELQAWLSWVDSWAQRAGAADPSPEIDEMHERRESLPSSLFPSWHFPPL